MAINPYLASTELIDWQTPAVRQLAEQLAEGCRDPLAVARRCFEWVRDEIKHSSDYQLNPVTCTASEVLAAGTGYCYAKSHLLAALLRANGLPAGLCYQRLSINGAGAPFCLHGLNAVELPGIGWYRMDARGNREDVDGQFTPPKERLAFAIQVDGEQELPDIYAEPLPVVVESLRTHATWDAVLANLPDRG
ncbi:transglutaminase-like domain-containing protein [Bythopirellula polymerisocia]|uniref:Transglutaminase-like superfamily protein n=1 Tax=Bythopirellula polymerisocia TaxID=2528003 RepID=A0A5C6CZ55_9BACT|nr:transglutaminase family protein [Bythopirellula polymerisocia]TWU29698.1 Transglutaminase-like superfamily protein [Bythopirellula polymerisocia]